MGRARDIANVLSSSTNIALDSELGLSLITPTSIATTGGSATSSISATGAVSFASASAISLNGCFTSTYDYYKIILDTEPSSASAANLRFRLRTTSDLTTADYNNSGVGNSTVASDTLVYTRSGTNATYWNLQTMPDNRRGFTSMDIYNPNIAAQTYFNAQSIINNGAQNTTGGLYATTTQATGFSVFYAAGNIAGTIRVYGYRN